MSSDEGPLFQQARLPSATPDSSKSNTPSSTPGAPQAPARLPPGTISGQVKSWIEKKKFGFIARDDGGDDIFFGDFTLEANGIKDIEAGDRLVFEAEASWKGDGKIYVRRIFALARGQKYLGIMEAKRRKGAEGSPIATDVPVDLPIQSGPSSRGVMPDGSSQPGAQPAPARNSGPPSEIRRLHPDALPFQGTVEEYDGARGYGTVRAQIAIGGGQPHREALVHFKHDLLSPSRLILPKKGEPIRGLCALAAHGGYAAVWLDDKYAGKRPSGGSRR